MKKISNADELRSAILLLESKQKEEGKLLKEQMYDAYENIKPINLIKSTLNDLGHSPEVGSSLLKIVLSVAAGYATKVAFSGISSYPIRKLLSTILLASLTNVVVKNPEAVKAFGKVIFDFMRRGVQPIAAHDYKRTLELKSK